MLYELRNLMIAVNRPAAAIRLWMRALCVHDLVPLRLLYHSMMSSPRSANPRKVDCKTVEATCTASVLRQSPSVTWPLQIAKQACFPGR
jgi:hypothetical protein